MSPTGPWFLYVVQCADGTLYTGITTDVKRRVKEHNTGRGARYTSIRRPVTLRGAWRCSSRKIAMQAETALKRKRRDDKLRLIQAAGEFRQAEWALD